MSIDPMIQAVVLAIHRGEGTDGMNLQPAIDLGLVEVEEGDVFLTVEGEDRAMEWNHKESEGA